jgi:uncharacterized cupredoxin-like copper-binding protein
MSAPAEQEPKQTDLSVEEEFADLQRQERSFERRVQNGSIWIGLAAFGALILSAAAFAVSLTNTSGTQTVVMRSPASGTAGTGTRGAGTAMPGAGMMGGRTASTAAAGARTVDVQLGEMFVRPNKTTINAGKVTFVAHNVGRVTHELMIERVPLKMDGPGRPNEEAAMGMVDDMSSGESGKMTLRLTPGTYQLFCNVPGHYAAGQHTTFTVT